MPGWRKGKDTHEGKWQCCLCCKPYWWTLQDVIRHEKTNEHQRALEREELKAAAGIASYDSDTDSRTAIDPLGTVEQEITQILNPHPLDDSYPLQDEQVTFDDYQSSSVASNWANIEFEGVESFFDRETVLSNYASSLARYILGGYDSDSDSEPEEALEDRSDAELLHNPSIFGM